MELVLFDLDGTLIDHDCAVATAVETWLLENGRASGLASLALTVTWDEIAEHHFPAYRARQVTFQGQRRMRLRDFLPYVGFDPSTWSGTQVDEAFAGYLRAYEAAWRPFPDVEPCLRALQPW